MRVAPVGLLFNNDPEFSFEIASQIAALTHGNPSGYLSSGLFASLISFIFQGETIEKTIESSLLILKRY